MALWVCRDCTALYAVGLPACPQCRSTAHFEEGEEEPMPKITRHGGASYASDIPQRKSAPGEPLPEIPADKGAEPHDPPPGEETSSPGNSSATSSKKPQTKPETSEKPRRKRARTTESRSKKAPTGSSTAPSTDGGQATGTSAKTSDDEK